ncbi:MAG TPA: glycosyl transferase, partial [Lachnospiraceae bacterium]|nr:glycosyl transferase [Lachnospiraceae bacterium]
MIGTEFIKGYGLGNQLFFYVTTRCIAEEKGVDFGFINPEQVGNVFHSNKG